MSKPVILTGLRANNDLHIGNYFGGLLPIIDMAKNKSNEYQINLFMPDLHSFTTPIDRPILKKQIETGLKIFVAAGLPLNIENVFIYRQSQVPAHSELTIILNSFTGMGEMGRMTQYKEKAHLTDIERVEYIDGFINRMSDDNVKFFLETIKKEEGSGLGKLIGSETKKELNRILKEFLDSVERDKVSKSSVGLFDYPVLMAADILLYSTKYVPVGDDQTQHLEFTRDIAGRMNNKYGELFVVPEQVAKQHEFFGKDQGLRIRDLADPAKKMSKSDESSKGVIFLTDSPQEAFDKVMAATTDSVGIIKYDPGNQPGVSNLLEIYALLKNIPIKQAESEFMKETQYKQFKNFVADAVFEFIEEFQAKLAGVNEQELEAKLKSSEEAMNEQANATLLKVQKAVGLR